MAKNKKYSFKIEQHGSTWKAQIVRQATTKRTVLSKEQKGFASKTEATNWAELQLQEFTTTLDKSNQRHSEQRKHSQQVRLERSARRAEKTQQAKQEKPAPENATVSDKEHDTID